MKKILFTLAIIASASAAAAPVYKCEDETGAVTYSQLGCADPAQPGVVVTPKNPTPGGDTPTVMAENREPEPQVVQGPAVSSGQLSDIRAREKALEEAERENEREREALNRQASNNRYYTAPAPGVRRVYVDERPAPQPAPPPQPSGNKGFRLKAER